MLRDIRYRLIGKVNGTIDRVVGPSIPLRRDLLLLLLATFCARLGFSMHQGTYRNFLVEEFGIRPQQFGLLESLREVPGFLTAAMAMVMVALPEPWFAAVAMMTMAAGFGAFSMAWSLPALISFTFIWSAGFHSWMPLQSAMTLGLSEERGEGQRLGQVRMAFALGTLAGLFLVDRIAGLLDFRGIYRVVALAMALGGLVIACLSYRGRTHKRTRFVLKRRYSLYYVLQFLGGYRRQIYSTFIIFAFVQVYHLNINQVVRLMLAGNLIGLLSAPWMGRLIDRWGERLTLSMTYILLTFTFVGYATVKQVHILYALYCFNTVLFILNIGVTTYLNKICPPEEINASLAMGQTMNHLAAITMPLVGGVLWALAGYQATFLLGAGLAVLSLLATQRIRGREMGETELGR